MAQELTNTWLRQISKRRLFRSNHYFIERNRSICGRCIIFSEDEKYIISANFEEIFMSKICKQCIICCEKKGIKYK